MRCNKCGSPIIEGAHFCTECGSAIINETCLCIECGFRNKNGEKYCSNCGSKLECIGDTVQKHKIKEINRYSYDYDKEVLLKAASLEEESVDFFEDMSNFELSTDNYKNNDSDQDNSEHYYNENQRNQKVDDIENHETQPTNYYPYGLSECNGEPEESGTAESSKSENKGFFRKSKSRNKQKSGRKPLIFKKQICDVCGREFTKIPLFGSKVGRGIICGACYSFADDYGVFLDRMGISNHFNRAGFLSTDDIIAFKKIVESNDKIMLKMKITDHSLNQYIRVDDNKNLFYIDVPNSSNHLVYRYNQIKSFYPVLTYRYEADQGFFSDEDTPDKKVLSGGYVEIALDDYYVKYLCIKPNIGKLPHFGKQKRILACLHPYLDFLTWMTGKVPGNMIKDD